MISSLRGYIYHCLSTNISNVVFLRFVFPEKANVFNVEVIIDKPLVCMEVIELSRSKIHLHISFIIFLEVNLTIILGNFF